MADLNKDKEKVSEKGEKQLFNLKDIYSLKLTDNSISQLDNAFQLAKEGFWNYNFTTRIFSCTNDIQSILEIKDQQTISDVWQILDRIHPSEKNKIKTLQSQLNEKVNVFNLNLRFEIEDGSSRHAAITAKVNRDAEGNPEQIFGTFRDVTEEFYQLQRLKENEELFRNLFNNLTDIFVIFEVVRDEKGVVVDYIYKDVNPIFEMKFDIARKEILNKRLSNQVQLFQQFHPLLKITATTHEPNQNSFFIPSIDAFVDVLIYSPGDQIIATIWRDVSLVMEASTNLRESEEKYRQIFSIGKDGLFMFDFFSGKIIDSNPAGAKMFDLPKEQLLKILFKELFTDSESLEHNINVLKATQINATGLKPDGVEFPIEATLSYFNWSGRKVVIASVRDTSERTKTQQELINSEKKFKQLFDFSNDAILLIRDYRITEYNQKTKQLFNLQDTDLSNATLWSLSPTIQPSGENSRIQMLELLQRAYQGDQLHFEWIFERSDKTSFFADIKLSTVFFENDKIIQAIIRDVSPRKQSEEALKLKESRWKQSLEIINTGVWEWDLINNKVYFSKIWQAMIGYKPKEFKESFAEYEKHIHPEDVERVFNAFENYFAAKNQDFSIIYRFRCKNGTYKWINCKGKINEYNEQGRPKQFVGTHTDVTKYILADQHHEKLEAQYQNALSLSKTGFWELNLKNLVISAPEETLQIFGIKGNQATLKQIEALVHPEDQKDFVAQFVNAQEGKQQNFNFRVIVDNQTKHITSIAQAVINANNKLTGFSGIFQDITFFKKDEQELKDDQKLIKSYLNKSSQAIISIQDEQIVFTNPRFLEITGFSAPAVQQYDFKLINLVVPEDKSRVGDYIETVVGHSSQDRHIEFRIETKSGRIKWLNMTYSRTEFRGREAVLYIIEDITNKKTNEFNANQTEILNKNIIVNAPLGIAILNHKTQVEFNNNEYLSIVKISGQKALQPKLEDGLKTNDLLSVKKAMNDFRNGDSNEYINEFELINGKLAHILLRPVKNEKQEIIHFILYIEDITSTRQQIKKLSEENLHNKLIFKGLETGFGFFNSSGKLLEYNQNLLSLFEIEDRGEEYNINQFTTSAEQAESLNRDTTLNLNYNFRTNSQKILAVQARHLQSDNHKGILLQAIDITEHRNQIKLLNTQLERFKSLFENAPIGIALIDKNRNIISCNQQYAKELGCSLNDLDDKRLDQIIQIENLTDLVSSLSELFAGVIPEFSNIMQIANKQGNKIWMNSSFAQLIDQYKEVLFAIHVIENISSYKENEDQLLNNERLKTLNYLANTFAHQFNNKLMAMYGNAYLLKSHLTDPTLLKYSEALFSTIIDASEVTNNLLSFSRNKHQIKVILNLHHLIQDIVDQLKLPYKIELETTFDEHNETVIGDSGMLKRAFSNLIDNAIEAMPDGGKITLETKSVLFEEVGYSNCPVPEKGRYIRISISDTGNGINRNDISDIFNPFYTTKSDIRNAGMGLTIAQKNVMEHGGSIRVKSAGTGTEIAVYIPQPDNELLNTIIEPDEQLVLHGSANILIIDDEDIVRIITAELLEKLGYNVFSFASGIRALKFYKEHAENIDLVLLDKHMPEMDGKEVYNRIMALNHQAKVVLLTGFNIDQEIQALFNSANCRIIQKPISIEKLSSTITSLLLAK